MERLEHEADALAPQTRPLLVGQGGGFHAIKSIEAAGRAIQAANDVQQRRLAGAGRSRDGQPLAPVQREVDIDQRVDRRFGAVLFADPAEFENPGRCAEQSSRILAGRVVVADHDELAGRELPVERSYLHVAVRGQARLYRHVFERSVSSTWSREVPSVASDRALTGTAVTAPLVDSIGIVNRTEKPSRRTGVLSTRMPR